MLERMYHKRLKTYKRIGFEVCSQVLDRQKVSDSIFDGESYAEVFGADLQTANSEIVISSPGLGSKKVWKFIHDVVPLQERGVRITVLTLASSSYPEDAAAHHEELIASLSGAGITVKCADSCREHFAVIDRTLVWYGSMNLLSREKEDDSMMRLESAQIAEELLLKCIQVKRDENV